MNVCKLVILCLCFLCPSSKALPSNAVDPGSSKVTLKVALFPWIPDSAEDDFLSLRESLEKEFEKRNPKIDLILRLKKWDDSYYNPAKIAGWLASGKFDLVEIDTIILGDLISSGTIEPWKGQNSNDFFPAAVQGATIKDDQGNIKWWGIPHLLCGYFLISNSKGIDKANSIDSLRKEVQQTGKPLLGNFESSWDLPSLYLDGIVDNGFQPQHINEAIQPPLNSKTVMAIETLSDLCNQIGNNPCLDGTYKSNWDGPVIEFVNGNASGFWGYSERLHLTIKMYKQKNMPIDNILVNTIPLGSSSMPLLFLDAFVKRSGCEKDEDCKKATAAFSDFINTDWALAELLLSKDAKSIGLDSIPRYLLPAKKSGFEVNGIINDRIYQELKPFAQSGYALPNAGEMYERRRLLLWILDKALD